MAHCTVATLSLLSFRLAQVEAAGAGAIWGGAGGGARAYSTGSGRRTANGNEDENKREVGGGARAYARAYSSGRRTANGNENENDREVDVPGITDDKCHDDQRHNSSQEPIPNPQISDLPMSLTRQSMLLNMSLSGIKGLVGVLTMSPALISDAAHSLTDITSDVVTMYSYKKARSSPDFSHPRGYGKFESAGTALVGTILVVTGLGVATHSLGSVSGAVASPPGDVAAAGAVAALGLFSKEVMYRRTLKAGLECGSGVVVANAHHHRSDAMSSAVALVGIAGGGFLGAPWLDPVAGLAVAGMVVKSGVDVAKDATDELLDIAVPPHIVSELAHCAASVPGATLKSRGSIRAVKSGPDILVDVSVTVDGGITASSAHQIGEHVRRAIATRFPNVGTVRVHFDPDHRQEWEDEGTRLMDPPEVVEGTVRATVKRKVQEVLGVTEVFIVYNRGGSLDLKVNLILHPDHTLEEANEIGVRVRAALRECESIAVREVDVDLELSECGEDEKGLIVVDQTEGR